MRGPAAEVLALPAEAPLPAGGLAIRGLSFEQLQALGDLLRAKAGSAPLEPVRCARTALAFALPGDLRGELAAMGPEALADLAKRWSGVPSARERRQRPLRELLDGLGALCRAALEGQEAVFVLVREP